MLKIPYIHVVSNDSFQDWSNSLEEIPWHTLDKVNWPDEYPYLPEVRFQIAYTDNHIILRYHVVEEFVKAQFIRHNEAVWTDSCVEFFLSFDQGATYYNLEFNPVGTGVIGYGPADKSRRKRLSAEQIDTVSTFTQISRMGNEKSWEIILIIPISLFSKDQGVLKGTHAHANFYKCGDNLPTPHFISWNPVDSPTPNFHLPQFFGEMFFE